MSSNSKIFVSRKLYIFLYVVLAILSVAVAALAIMYSITSKNLMDITGSVENLYQRTYYELTDTVNTTENNLSKVVNSNSGDYQKKLLAEISDGAKKAQQNLSYLPISVNGISDTISFFNQLGGYTFTLAEKTEPLTAQEKEKLAQLHTASKKIKTNLQSITADMLNGYNISSNTNHTNGDFNSFTRTMQNVNSDGTEYPSMIYDGPFSKSVVSKQVKGLSDAEISKEEAAKKLCENLGVANENVKFKNETNGRFKTYDFSVDYGGGTAYVQVAKAGGKLLTLSSYANKSGKNFGLPDAVKTAEEFANKLGIKNMKCVWSDISGLDAYVNLAPVENNIIFYPDLIKVKVDLSNNKIIGWEASSYYTNHISRTLPSVKISSEEARAKISGEYKIISEKLALIPLDFNKESLCHEFKCQKDGDNFYIYICSQSGNEKNILKEIRTENGYKLM